MSDPPFRKDSSLEMTAVRPRPALPDADDIMLTEMLAAAERTRRDAEDAIDTLVACPGPCNTCVCCRGEHMVSAERAAKWRADHGEVP
jgi:hypothetical protein